VIAGVSGRLIRKAAGVRKAFLPAAALAAAVALLGLVGLIGAGPAGAIETAQFGLNPSGAGTRTALHEDVRPGHHVTDSVVVWNKTDSSIDVVVGVSSASIGKDGKPTLGGSGGSAKWVHLGAKTVHLAPRARATVPVRINVPRVLPAGTSLAAVTAEAAPGANHQIAVIERVALMVYVKAAKGSSLRAALGWILWVAVVLLVLAVVGLLVSQRSRPAT
jgi:hypothetical protein